MFNIKKIRKDIALIKERKNMSELVIKTAKDNGDLPEDFDDHKDSNKLQEYYKRQTILHQWVGRPLPEKEKA